MQKGMISSDQFHGLANNAAELSSTDQVYPLECVKEERTTTFRAWCYTLNLQALVNVLDVLFYFVFVVFAQDTWYDFADNLPELGDLNATDIAVRHGGFVSVFGVALSLCKPGYMPTRRLVDCAMFSMLIFEK